MAYGLSAVQGWISEAATTFAAQAAELNELDRALGDGDHGTNMASTFSEAARMDFSSHESAADAWHQIGMIFLGAGVDTGRMLFGTYFLALAAHWPSEPNTPRIAACLREARDAVQARSGAEVGDKTMIDALDPVVRAVRQLDDDTPLTEALRVAAEAATEGRDKTAELTAQVGRGTPLRFASVGHVDPGAASVAIFFDIATRHVA